MAQPHPQKECAYQNVEIFMNEENTLGCGSYGVVYQAKCDELPCAAKCLHPVFFQFNDPGVQDVIGKFQQECRFLSTVRHPNIIQYLGMVRDPNSGRPILLMELMDESLTKFLDQQTGPLPYHMQVSLAHDVALALAYLHSNRIIHRDLSSNNVLMIAGRKAKVTDFGMSKLIGVNPHITPLTRCPGTQAYMAPEALWNPPVYSEKLDCFSEGVLIIQIITRQFPNPGPPRRMMNDSRFEVGTIEIPIPETERRHSHIVLINPTHPLLQIALKCLEYRQEERPTAQELCRHIATLKEAQLYTESVQRGQEVIDQLKKQNLHLQEQLRHRDGLIMSLQQNQQLQVLQIPQLNTATNQQLQSIDTTVATRKQNQDLQRQLQSQNDQLKASNATLQREIQHFRQALQQVNKLVQDKDREIETRRSQLQELNQVTAEFQQNLLQKERMVSDLEARLAAKDKESREQQSSRGAGMEGMKLMWRENGKAPCTMSRGTAAVEGSVAYFKPDDSKAVYAYNSGEEWSQLPDCPHSAFSLVVVKGLVTAVGGYNFARESTNTLLSLTGQDSSRKWEKHFPSMLIKRSSTAAAYDGKNLIVAGGCDCSGDKITTVEVMDTDITQWYTATCLPYPLALATATISGDRVYLLGGSDHKGETKSVLTCSLTALQSCQAQSLSARLRSALTLQNKSNVWHTIANIPVYFSTCATLRGELVAIGGSDINGRRTTAVYQYSPTTDSWQTISQMKTARDNCLVAVLPHNKLVVVGGYTSKCVATQTDIVESATVL